MATPRTIYEQIKNMPFEPDESIAVLVSTSFFDKAVDEQNHPGFEHVREAEAEAEDMRDALQLYGITEDENIYKLSNPTGRECHQTLSDLTERFRIGEEAVPKRKFLVIFMFTGRGVIKENMTEIVLNEYDYNTKFYKLFKAEGLLREMST